MGNSLMELDKIAGIFPRVLEFAKRFGSPLKGIQRGWEAHSPVGLMRQGGDMGEGLRAAISRTQAAEKAIHTSSKIPAIDLSGAPIKGLFKRDVVYDASSIPGKVRAHLASNIRAGSHLAPDHQVAPGVKGLAERASRSGWTGEGKLTKYLPVGQKGMLLSGTLASMPGIVDAMRYGPSEYGGGVGEQALSLAGFTVPAVMAGGMPTASFVIPLLGGFAGGRLGKALDHKFDPRVRALEAAQNEQG